MLYQIYRKLRRTARNWTTDPTRADRNAVIQRIVTAAAAESKDRAPLGGEVRRAPTPPPAPSALASQLLGREPDEELVSGEQIGQRAFEIWVRNGRPVGTASKDWSQAEAELKAEARR